MEREVKRLISAFMIAGLLVALGSSVASGASIEKSISWTSLATIGGLFFGLLISWLTRRS